MEKLRLNQCATGTVEGYSSEGLGIVRLNGAVVFVPRAVRGEEIELRIIKVMKTAAAGEIVRIIRPSPERVKPECPYYGRCGGCDFQHLTYGEELWAKRQRVQDALARLGRHGQKLVFRPAGAAGQTVSAPLLAPLLGTKRHIAPLAAPLHLAGGADLPARDGMPTVAFFPGCLGDKMFPDMSKACLKALTWHGVGVWLPPGLACCGIPALASGDARGFARMAARNLEILATRAFDALVTPCATCTTTIARLWPRRLGGAKLSPAAARLLAELPVRAQDIHAFLVRTCGAPAHLSAASPTDAPRLVAYHDSCHLKKGLGVTTEPRALIAANPAYRLVEMERADACCGHGGSFNLFRYDLSSRIGRAKRDAVVASGADTVAAGCPACMLQLMDMLAKNGDTIRVRHSLEIYAEALPDASDGQSGSGDSGPGRG